MKAISKIVGQQRLEGTSQLTRQLSNELEGLHPRNFQEVGGSHRSPKQVESWYLPSYRREEGTLTNFYGERSNPVRTIAPQKVFVSTNSVTHPEAYNEPLPLARGMGSTYRVLRVASHAKNSRKK